MAALSSFGLSTYSSPFRTTSLTSAGQMDKAKPKSLAEIAQHPKGAKVRPAQLIYHEKHFLGIPTEIRQNIWAWMATGISEEHRPLAYKPEFQILGLLLTCRQTYCEVQLFWRRFDVPWNRLRKFLSGRINRTNIKQFKSLMIEVRLDAHPGYILGLTRLLRCAATSLTELRLHFIGSDLYGTQTYVHGCGNIDREGQETKLPVEGQRLEEFIVLWDVVAVLRNLEILVITNANLQCYQSMFLSNKSFLKYLHLSADPRSTPHRRASSDILGRLLQNPRQDAYPPVKVLHIAANATVCSVPIATKVMPTLEHLTWTTPDPSLSSGMTIPSYEHTAVLFDALRLRAPNLSTLRICLSGAGLYEHATGYDNLIGSIRLHLPFLKQLRHLEIHMKNKSPFFGQELLRALPLGLEHLYISDYLVHPYDLFEWLWVDILNNGTQARPNTIPSNPGYRLTKTSQGEEICKGGSLQDCLPNNPDPWLIKLDSFSYHPGENGDEIHENRNQSDRLIRRRPEREKDLYMCGATGQDQIRHDYIPFRTGNLRFVHCEFDHSTTTLYKPNDLTPLQTLLYVNGRLLDRSRNRHLDSCRPGSFIRPRKLKRSTKKKGDKTKEETMIDSSYLEYSVLLYSVYNVEATHPKDINSALAELEASDLTDDKHYFGTEDQAQRVFEKEPVAKIDELPELRYPVEREVCVDGLCHWNSPDAIPPSVSKREQERKPEAAGTISGGTETQGTHVPPMS